MLSEFLSRWFDRIVNAITALGAAVTLAIGGGCGTDEIPATTPAPVPNAIVVQPPVRQPDEGPHPIGDFNITFYYVIGEDEVVAKTAPPKPANDNEETDLASVAPPEMVTLYDGSSCEPISEVTKDFAAQLEMQGTGKLRDGRVLNIWGACRCDHSPCFKITETQWGTAGSGRALQPFRTVAVDPKVVKLGSLLYVPLLEGRTMPGRAPWGGFVHDGCVVADDTGGHIDGNRLDLFVGRKGYFLGLSGSGGSHAWARHVPVFDGTGICERKGRIVAKRTAAI
ncbi:MAG TPA: 3D domain-containing protein [Kofleriaceae bacterium]|jgi:3D (Asp-Asp-Asp) domain-containing protein